MVCGCVFTWIGSSAAELKQTKAQTTTHCPATRVVCVGTLPCASGDEKNSNEGMWCVGNIATWPYDGFVFVVLAGAAHHEWYALGPRCMNQAVRVAAHTCCWQFPWHFYHYCCCVSPRSGRTTKHAPLRAPLSSNTFTTQRCCCCCVHSQNKPFRPLLSTF